MPRENMPVMSSKTLHQVPMAMLAPHEKQAIRNHGQTLERLAERGGMACSEILAVINGLPWASVKVCEQNDLLLLRMVEQFVHTREVKP